MNPRFENVKKILICTDGSAYSARAAEYGISIAKQLGVEVIVVYVIDVVSLEQVAKATNRELVEREMKSDGERNLSYIKGIAENENVKAATILAEGRPYEQIVHLAKGLSVDLIVMGTYGRRGAERILIGNVSERVIEYATCPVLVVK